MEFGVASGRSLREWRGVIPLSIPLFGFDSFEGLPGPWGQFPAGSFATRYRVNLPNTELVVGYFAQTIPPFAALHGEPVSLIHVDCDLYESTTEVLNGFADRIGSGTVIVFDELHGYDGFEKYEYRALDEFLMATGKQIDVIGRWNAYRAAVQFR